MDLDDKIKLTSHTQKLAIQYVELQIAIANAKVEVATKWIEAGIRGEELANMRRARKEYSAQLRTLKARLRKNLKIYEKISKYSQEIDKLIWSHFINNLSVASAWRSLLNLTYFLEPFDQIGLTKIPLEKEFFRKLNSTKELTVSSRNLFDLILYCKNKYYVPVEGSLAQEFIFKVIKTIDIKLNEKTINHLERIEKLRLELNELRITNWKKQNII